MNYPTICIDNFLSNPDEVVEYSKKLEFFKDEDNQYPGERAFLTHTDINQILLNKIFTIIHPHKTEHFKAQAKCFFQKINNQYGDIGWIHSDKDLELTAILYLSKNKNCGTSLYKPKSFTSCPKNVKTKQEFYKTYKKPKDYDKLLKENNNQFEETVYFESVYNRLIIFNSDNYHGVRNFNIGLEPRLTYISFIHSFSDINYKNSCSENRKIITI